MWLDKAAYAYLKLGQVSLQPNACPWNWSTILLCESCTGYSFSEARFLASINPKVDIRFFIDSTVRVHVDYKKSYVYFWINWCKNESFWKSISCIIMIPSIGKIQMSIFDQIYCNCSKFNLMTIYDEFSEQSTYSFNEFF